MSPGVLSRAETRIQKSEFGNSAQFGSRYSSDSDVLISESDPSFAGLVVIAGEFHPIPFRTRPLKPPAPMVLRVNTWESRSPPGLPKTEMQIPPSRWKQ